MNTSQDRANRIRSWSARSRDLLWIMTTVILSHLVLITIIGFELTNAFIPASVYLVFMTIMGIMGIFSAPLILVANVSLDVKDRLSASEMSETCGGEAIENTKIAQDVAVNGSLGFLLQGSNISIYPGGEEVPVSTGTEAAR